MRSNNHSLVLSIGESVMLSLKELGFVNAHAEIEEAPEMEVGCEHTS